jgi:hypothetical protein
MRTGPMSHIRFRIRTIMITIAAMAVLMGLLMNGGAVAMTTVFLAASALEISAYLFYLSRGRMRR